MSSNFTYLQDGVKSEVIDTDHNPTHEYPNLGGLAVWIEGNCFRSGAIEMFVKAGCTAAPTIEAADIICFLGGEDINPGLYNEKVHKYTRFNYDRDKREVEVFNRAIELEIPMIGLCRGMQFLHAMNGGKLYQHVSNHTSRHDIIDNETGKVLRTSSMHHQMCIEDDDTYALAYAKMDQFRKYEGFNTTLESNKHLDLEAAIYPKINSIAFQGHPELGDLPEYTAWCLNKVKDFLYEDSVLDAIEKGSFKRADGTILPRNINNNPDLRIKQQETE